MDKTKELTKYERISRNRIKSLINTYCDGSQREFAKRTGLNIGSVSQYVNGKNVPSSKSAQKIADAFGVAAEWVMGFENSDNSLKPPPLLRFKNRDKICDENSIKKEHPEGCSIC